MPNPIERKWISLQKRRQKLMGDLHKLQTDCPHERARGVNKSDTGNYDPSADAYWTDWSCPDCGKLWTTDGSI